MEQGFLSKMTPSRPGTGKVQDILGTSFSRK